jgi:VWFA-related protein
VDLAGAQAWAIARRADGRGPRSSSARKKSCRRVPRVVLGRLANDTGGFMIDNTNDLGKGVARMQVERVTYYLLGYQPTNAATDGKFRKVSVK